MRAPARAAGAFSYGNSGLSEHLVDARSDASHRVTLCASCPLGQGGFVALLAKCLPDWQVDTVECMSGCKRPSTLAFRAPGKTAYLFGEITEVDLPEIESFAAAYRASVDGNFADARIFGALRLKAIARIPP